MPPMVLTMTLSFLSSACAGSERPVGGQGRYGEPHRPQFHFTPERNWMNDLPPLLDVEMVFDEGPTAAPFEVRLETGKDEAVVILRDAAAGKLEVDRTRSGLTKFHEKFPGRNGAPLRSPEGRLDLRLLVDASSIEVFAVGGETALTALRFPEGETPALRLRALGEKPPAVGGIAIHELKSAWR
jgi:fructan beta-fructosidase